MKKWVAITGGTGYIGSHLAAKIKDTTDWSVLLIDKSGKSYPNATQYCDIFADEDFSSKLIEQTIKGYKPALVIHCAEDRQSESVLTDPMEIWQDNAIKNSSFLRTCGQAGVPKFIFLSTSNIYSGSHEFQSESDKIKPFTCWARNKLMIEQMLNDCYISYGMNSVSLRLTKVGGCCPEKNIGPLPHANDVFNRLIQSIVQNKTFEIYGNDFKTNDGTPVRDFIHIMDVVNAILKVDSWLDSYKNGSFIMNLGSGSATSIEKLVLTAGDILGQKIKYTYAGREPAKPASLLVNTDFIRHETDWKPIHDLHSMILSTFKWYNS